MHFENDVDFSGHIIGKANVRREGLYYRFFCTFFPEKEGIYRILMHCGEKKFDLGIGLPSLSGFELLKKIPVKQIPEGEYRFSVIPEKHEERTVFVPLRSTEPFREIKRLRCGIFQMESGIPGIRFPVQDLQGNDPNP